MIYIFFIPNLDGEGQVGATLFYKKIEDQKWQRPNALKWEFAKGSRVTVLGSEQP